MEDYPVCQFLVHKVNGEGHCTSITSINCCVTGYTFSVCCGRRIMNWMAQVLTAN